MLISERSNYDIVGKWSFPHGIEFSRPLWVLAEEVTAVAQTGSSGMELSETRSSGFGSYTFTSITNIPGKSLQGPTTLAEQRTDQAAPFGSLLSAPSDVSPLIIG